jgi:hypothetical protein
MQDVDAGLVGLGHDGDVLGGLLRPALLPSALRML